MHRFILIPLIALTVAGCASRQEKLAQELRDRERVMRELEEDRREWAQDDAKHEMRRIPDWALEPAPSPDSTGVYAVASANSDDAQLAIRKAHLQALYDLGRTLNSSVSGLERLHSADNGGTSNRSYSQVVQSLVDWTDTTGAEVVKQEIVPINGRFHAAVMLKLPFEAANNVLQERRRRAASADQDRAFEQFQDTLEDYRSTLAPPTVSALPESPPAQAAPLAVAPQD
jgi:hypothetical protein